MVGGGQPINVTVAVHSFVPPTPQQSQEIGRHAVEGMLRAAPTATPRLQSPL
jgi:hypothetical protein